MDPFSDDFEPNVEVLAEILDQCPVFEMEDVEFAASPVALPQSPTAATKPILIPQSPSGHRPHPLNLTFSPKAPARFVHVVTSTIVRIDGHGNEMEPVFTETVFMQELGTNEPAVFTELGPDGIHVRTGPNPRLLKALDQACL